MRLEHWKWMPYKVTLLVSNFIMPKRTEMALASQCQPSHFYSWVQTRPCCFHPILLYLLMQNLSLKDIFGS